MSRSGRKRFEKFLAARAQRRHLVGAQPSLLSGRPGDPLAGMRAAGRVLIVPAVFLAVYGLLALLNLFTPLYPWLLGAALSLYALWVVLAVRGAMGFWAHAAHLRFAVPVAVLLGLGASWGVAGDVQVKAWVTPPAYARLPSVSLADASAPEILAGSVVHLSGSDEIDLAEASFAGQSDKLEAVGGEEVSTSFVVPDVSAAKTMRLVLRRGWLRLGVWTLRVVPDRPPQIALTEMPEITARKTIRFAFDASDDYGVEAIAVRVAPTAAAPGLSTEPIEVPLLSASSKQVRSASYADLTSLPWAGLPVTVQLVVTDGAGHKGWSAPQILTLPTRSFRHPLARALIEERQKLLGQRDVGARDEAANVMAGIARQQGLYRGDSVVTMALRAGAVRLVLNKDSQTVPAIGEILWQTAIRLEEGEIGQARAELAGIERDLSSALAQQAETDALLIFLARMNEALGRYFAALDAERARQPPALQDMDWPLATASELLTPEDLQGKLASVAQLLQKDDRAQARERLDQLQSLIENLRTTPPELTPAQYVIVGQVSALRALVRGQKSLAEDTERLQAQAQDKTPKGRKTFQAALARHVAQQQLLLSALREVNGKAGQAAVDAKMGERAMAGAIQALRQKDVDQTQQKQAEALALLQNSLLALTEQMRKSLAAKAP